MRIDNFCVVVGALVLIEMVPAFQYALSHRMLQYLGHLSLSLFLMQGFITYTVGVKMFMFFVRRLEWNTMSAAIVIFIVDLPLVILAADVYARLVDYSGRKLSSRIFDFYTS